MLTCRKTKTLTRQTVVVINKFPFTHGGGSQEVRFRIRLLVKHGFDVLLILRDAPEDDCIVRNELGPAVRLMKMSELFYPHPSRYLSSRLREYRRECREISEIMKDEQPAAIMVHGERPSEFYINLQKYYKVYFFLHDATLSCCMNERSSMQQCPHGPSIGCLFNRHPDMSHSMIRRAGKMVLRRLDLWRIGKLTNFVANSRYIATVYHRPDAIIQYPPFRGVESAGDEDRAHSGRDLRSLVFAGRLEATKGPLDALQILGGLPSSFRLSVVGDGGLRYSMEQWALAMNLGGRVDFTGWIEAPRVRSLIRQAGCILIPSRWDEAFANVVIEAFSEGTPVVGYDVGGLGEFVREPVGILVPRGDTAMAAQAVETICSDPEEWRSRSLACREVFARHFAPERFEDEVLAMVR